MRLRFMVALAILIPLAGVSLRGADPLVHTFSIVARDPQTGDMGVAVQSHCFSIGSIVIWAEAGVAPWLPSRSWTPATGSAGSG